MLKNIYNYSLHLMVPSIKIMTCTKIYSTFWLCCISCCTTKNCFSEVWKKWTDSRIWPIYHFKPQNQSKDCIYISYIINFKHPLIVTFLLHKHKLYKLLLTSSAKNFLFFSFSWTEIIVRECKMLWESLNNFPDAWKGIRVCVCM